MSNYYRIRCRTCEEDMGEKNADDHSVKGGVIALVHIIPVPKMLKRLEADPYYPVYWGSNKPGMQAGAELDAPTQTLCKDVWSGAMKQAMENAKVLRDLGLHKQDANRLLEPWMWQKIIISGTEWSNFFHLRNHPDAHPAFQTVAAMMQELYEDLEPRELKPGQWHLPLVDSLKDGRDLPEGSVEGETADEFDKRSTDFWVKVSTGRCARTSTLTHDGKRKPIKDVELHDKLLGNGHMSPFEHPARPATDDDVDLCMVKWSDLEFTVGEGYCPPDPRDMWFGNYRGWVQYRKLIPHEADIMGTL